MSASAAPERSIPRWDQTTAEIDTPIGRRSVPALTHPWCAHLAVTMNDFGCFRVTHIPSGRSLGAEYERAASACVELAEWIAIGRLAGIPWDSDDRNAIGDALRGALEREVPFGGATTTDARGTRPILIRTWVNITRSHILGDEFPWEAPDESPWARADAVLATLDPERAAGAQEAR